VVVTVSVLAYFTAYALKGKELKINKIDLIDIDMRSKLNDELRPAGATAYGTSWFTILSPRIQNYTIGIEPIAKAWLLVNDPLLPPPTVSWMGRADVAGIGGSGRGRSQGLFNRTYAYEADAVGLRDVPIPVWTTKAFTASWVARFGQLPLEVDLHYETVRGGDNLLTGTIKSNLPVVLNDAGIVYQGKWYPLNNKNNVNQLSSEDGVVNVEAGVDRKNSQDLNLWIKPQDARRGFQVHGFEPESTAGAMQDPWRLMKQVQFYETAHPDSNHLNHALRNLDLSWRARDNKDDLGFDQNQVREAILVARLSPAIGLAKTFQDDADPRLGTLLWLGALPGGDRKLPELQGNLVQYTFVRVLLPVAPKKK
jgi:hypothetical protein